MTRATIYMWTTDPQAQSCSRCYMSARQMLVAPCRNRRNYPDPSGQLERDSSQFMHSSGLLALRWRDEQDVYMLSIIHTPDYLEIAKVVQETSLSPARSQILTEHQSNTSRTDRKPAFWSSFCSIHRFRLS